MYKVLLVDDEPLAVEGLELMIDWKKRGFQIDGIYMNGEDAIRRIRRDPPDLVVTDIRMPVLDGLELIDETHRSGNRTTLFVIASGYDDFDYARRAMRLGVRHYLTKPVIGSEADGVLEELQKELRERERRKVIRDSADRYAARRALSALLFGGEEAERKEATRSLSHLSGQAAEWTYVHVGTGAEEESGQAREAAQRVADESRCCYLVDGDRGAFGFVFGSSRSVGSGEEDEGGVRPFAERLLRAMRSASPGRVGIAVGCGVSDLSELSRSFASAAVAERFLFFGSAIVYDADIRGKSLSFDPEVLKASGAIVDAMESGNPDSLAAAVRAAYLAFEEQMTAPDLVGIFSTQVVLRCAAVYKELGGDPNELLKQSGFGSFIGQSRHLRESAETVADFCLRCQSAASALRDRQTGGTLAKVADYLRRNYTETMTIKELAERFYLSLVYLGQSFAHKYGVGILEFIHDLRIEEAKRQLRDTDCASCAIAESLGYRGYQHFLKQFEKRLGMKPADYRFLYPR